jgi:hypothetical protein
MVAQQAVDTISHVVLVVECNLMPGILRLDLIAVSYAVSRYNNHGKQCKKNTDQR